MTKRHAARAFLATLLDPTPESCIIWPFSRNNSGYAEVRVHGRKAYVHRIACEIANGPPPSVGHHASHSCGKGNLGCVNPRHLSWKTASENEADKVLHGTAPRGSRNHFAKLSEADVLRIREAAGTMPQEQIARTFGVRQNLISRIINRRIWAHV